MVSTFITKTWDAFILITSDHLKKLIQEYFLFRDKLKSLYGWSFVAWATMLCLNPYHFADLHEVYTDHIRHEYVSWAFLQVGLRVFYDPLGDLALHVHALNPHPTWPMVPSLYPAGMILLFLPFGALSNLGIMDDVLVHKLMVLTFLIAAYLCVHQFNQLFEDTGQHLGFLVPTLFFLNATYWALNGFYDLIPLLLVLLATRSQKERRHERSAILVTLAMFLHYRAVMYLPLLLSSVYGMWSERGESPSKRRWIVTSAVVGMLLFTAYTFYLSYSSITQISIPVGLGGWDTSPVHIYAPKNTTLQLFFILVTGYAYLRLMRRWEMVSSLVLLLFWVYASFIVNWRSWHSLFFFPLAVLPEDGGARRAALLWLLTVLYLFDLIINPIYVVDLVRKMLGT